jgi:[acyl-carrier-protein] S-malonyltransferase
MSKIDGNFTLLFPGQGSQSLRMGMDLAAQFPAVMDLYMQADAILGLSLSKIAWDGPEDQLNDTINTQPALLIHSIASLMLFHEMLPDEKPTFVAGHSMGEISALIAAKALDFAGALRLARIRGELMKEAGDRSPGGMAAILGLDIPTLEHICEISSDGDNVVQVANDNSPGQVVISGSKTALEKAMRFSQEAGARRVIPLNVSIAAHSPLMAHAQEKFSFAIANASIQDPLIPVGNVTATPLSTSYHICADLKGQLSNRVRWTESILFMSNQGIKTYFELGNKEVLTGLVKRIDKDAICYPLGTLDQFKNLRETFS